MANRERLLRGFGVGFLLLGALLILASLAPRGGAPAELPPTITSAATLVRTSAAPSATPEPLIPTRTPFPATPAATATWEAVVTPAPSATLEPGSTTESDTVEVATVAPSALPAPFVVPAAERFRLGVSLAVPAHWVEHRLAVELAPLQVGWTMDWHVQETVVLDDRVRFAQTVRMKGGVLNAEAEQLAAVAAARPGSLWLIANEPDVRWQDNVDPETFARLYHDAYAAIKRGDPTAMVAAGGIAQPTELRLRYLDLALDAYHARYGEALPAEAWHIHNYMLREERDGWGADIPPGLADQVGAQLEIADSGNLALFKAQIRTFRLWMVERGYGGLPLVISEFGIPMPPDYGYAPDVVAHFLRETTHYMLTASDPVLGVPNDGGRLVQSWCWFNLASREYPTGNLIDVDTGAWTELGRAWLEMVGVEP